MRRLMFVGHAKTETERLRRDQDRGSMIAGRSDASKSRWIRRASALSDLVLVSPPSGRIRPGQSLEAMRTRAAAGIKLLPELLCAEPTQLLRAIRMASSSDPKRLMLVATIPACMSSC